MEYTEEIRRYIDRRRSRSPAGELPVNAFLVEADDPGAPDLDDRYPRLPGLPDEVAGGGRVSLDVDLLERDPPLAEVPLYLLS